MSFMEKKVIRVTDAREVIFDKGVALQKIGFDMGIGYLNCGYPKVEINYEHPHFFSSIDSGMCLFEQNYFLGNVQVRWQPSSSERKRRELTDWEKKNQVERFTLLLPEERVREEIFNKAVEQKEKIREWMRLWYRHSELEYCRICRIGNISKEEIADIERKANEIWKELEEKKLTKGNCLLNPQYLLIFPQVKDSWIEKAHEFGVEWITPNVCVMDNKEDFDRLYLNCVYEGRNF